MSNPAAMSTPSIQTMVSKYGFFKKSPPPKGLFLKKWLIPVLGKEMIKVSLKYQIILKSKKVNKGLLGFCQNVSEFKLKSLLLSKVETIWSLMRIILMAWYHIKNILIQSPNDA